MENGDRRRRKVEWRVGEYGWRRRLERMMRQGHRGRKNRSKWTGDSHGKADVGQRKTSIPHEERPTH